MGSSWRLATTRLDGLEAIFRVLDFIIRTMRRLGRVLSRV